MHLSKVFLETESELDWNYMNSNSLSGTSLLVSQNPLIICTWTGPKVSGRESLSQLQSLTYMYLYVEIHQERLSGDDGKVSLVSKGNLTTTTTLLKTPKYNIFLFALSFNTWLSFSGLELLRALRICANTIYLL